MNKYPEYVKSFKPKGTIVKKVRDTYYVYKATSKRVEGKKYPVQVIEGLMGKIDEYGFHPMTKMMVDTESVRVYECGFTNYLLKFEEEFVSRKSGKLTYKEKREIYKSIIVYLSPNSYLKRTEKIYSEKELVSVFGISVVRKLTSIQKMAGYSMNELEPLKYICRVYMGNKEFKSELNEEQKQMLERIGVRENEIR